MLHLHRSQGLRSSCHNHASLVSCASGHLAARPVAIASGERVFPEEMEVRFGAVLFNIHG